MQNELRSLLPIAQDTLREYGLEVRGLHYFLTAPHQCFSRRRQGIAICFDAVTNNPNFFGATYENWRRIKLVDLAFQAAGAEIARVLPQHELYADVRVRLEKPYACDNTPAFEGLKITDGGVDVTIDNSVNFVEVGSLLEGGVIEQGCTLQKYCSHYKLPHILRHGRHFISPDSSSVEAFEAICEMQDIKSVLEIGGGVGTCGVAAERRGIKDYTFVDLNPKVCDYLRARFPTAMIINADAFNFSFYRKWDVVLMGMPYELNPWFLAQKGSDLRVSTDVVIFQSGCTAFFEFEHDWIFGRQVLSDWPWWQESQTVRPYFPYSLQMALDWQTCIVAKTVGRGSFRLGEEMIRRGFSHINYQRVML